MINAGEILRLEKVVAEILSRNLDRSTAYIVISSMLDSLGLRFRLVDGAVHLFRE